MTIVLAQDGSNEDDFTHAFMDANGKLKVEWSLRHSGAFVTAPDDDRDFSGFVPEGARVSTGSLWSEPDIVDWLYTRYLNSK